MVKKKIVKKVVTKLDEFKRKKYKPFTKEHLATFHRLENRSDILKPKKIKRKKGEINIIALPPRKKMKGGLINPVIKGAIKRLKKKGKWPTKSPYAKDLKEAKKPKTKYHYLGKKRTDVPGQKIPVIGYTKTTGSKHQKKMWAKMKKPALKEKKAQRIGEELIKKTKIIPKILRQITKPADDYADFMKATGSIEPKHKKLLSRFSKHLVGLKAPSKRLNKARQAINKLFRYRQQQQIKQSEIMRSGARKVAAGKGFSPKEIEEILPKSLREPMKFRKHPQLRQGGVIKKVKEPAESKKLRKSIQKIKSKKTTKKKLITGVTEAVKFTKWPERLSTKEPSKKGYWVDPQGGGLYHGVTSVRRAGRKTTLKSGKLSVSKKGNEYEALYGRTKYQQRPGYKSIGRGGKDWSAEVYGTKRDSGFRFQRTWRYKEGGVVPNKKGEFIAIGCGKIMRNRRKTTKIR